MKSPSSQLPQAEIVQKLKEGQTVVGTWGQLHQRLERMRDTAWIFRGVSDPDHYPVPSIGREKIYGSYKLAQETRLFEEFKLRAVALLPRSDFDDWHWLAYAQHLGVPTRLLDWTTSPLVAAFFALQSDSKSDRAIYCVKYSKFLHEVERAGQSPFAANAAGRFTPPMVISRIQAQRGLFTIHSCPTKIFYQEGMQVLVIPHKCVKEFRRRLFKYGIDYWHIYPDGEGLGMQLRWHCKEKIGLGSIFVNK